MDIQNRYQSPWPEVKALTEAQLAEVKRRIAEVESGEVDLISGDEVFALARRLLAERTAKK